MVDRGLPVRILLVGMMGSGKTTIAGELATRTGWPIADNDDLVRELTGREPADIAAADGEDALHTVEVDALARGLALPTPRIVGVAGAIVGRPAVGRWLTGAGHVVWLRARPETLEGRIGAGIGRRPEAHDTAWLAARSTEREPLYRAVADQVIDVDDLDPAAIAAAILAASGIPSAG